MLCRIADLITEVPTAGGMAPRCKEYLFPDDVVPDIIISADRYRVDRYTSGYEMAAYMESGAQFCRGLLEHDGFYLHAAAIELDGKAYLFSGPSGVGKSTHTRLWQEKFGAAVQRFNDDKPALRFLDDTWYAYGTPWCGKDGINLNMKVPIAGICFLVQGNENRIRRLSNQEAVSSILWQTMRRFRDRKYLDLLLDHVGKLVETIPIYELTNRPEPAAAELSYETMRRGAQEAGL